MGFDDLRHTGLVLGLGLPSSSPNGDTISRKSSATPQNLDLFRQNSEPTLTLSLSGEVFVHRTLPSHKTDDFDYNKVPSDDALQSADHLYGQDSAASSFSNVSVKREREVGSEEVDIERVSSRVSDEDDDGSNARKKLRLTKAQSALLEESFKMHSTLNPVITFSSHLFLSLNYLFFFPSLNYFILFLESETKARIGTGFEA